MADGQAIDLDTPAADTATAAATATFGDAQEQMRCQRWAEAAQILSRVSPRDDASALQLNICRNLAAMQEHRPRVYAALVNSQDVSRYHLGTSASGHPTIFYRTDRGTPLSMSPGNQPVAALSAAFASVKEPYQAGQPMALLGIGDGYFIKSCSLHPPRLDFAAEQPVYLFEPDEQAVLACLTLHDYSGPGGPIEQPRFFWFVGPDWLDQAKAVLVDEPYNPAPKFQLTQSANPARIHGPVKELLDLLYTEYERARLDAALHYTGVPAETLVDLLGPAPSRQPRVLLITTRRSTVLQHSTRDAAEGFRELGWQALVMIEPQPHHVVTPLTLARTLCEYQPDLVFQIDHLRQEWSELIPPQLPFVCWIQDHMAHLASQEFGRATGKRDFLLCGMPSMYVERHGYPKRQFLKMPKLTRVSNLKSQISNPRFDADVVYVSTASATPEQRVMEILGPGHCPEAQAILRDCCRRMIDVYAAGQTLPTIDSIGPLLDEAQRSTGHSIDAAGVRQQMLETLFDRLNNPLYRQQALRWAAGVAGRLGLKLAIYGKGWEQHPEFAPYARGPIAYGDELEALTRASRFNLVLEPTLNISHQRLLDALAAGGFCLIRHHPANVLFQEILNFLLRHAPRTATTVPAVLAALPPERAAEFAALIDRFRAFATLGDAVEYVRGLEESQILLPREAMLPRLADVSFDSEAELEQRVVEGLADDSRRRAIAAEQRADVAGRFSYAAGMRRTLRWIAGLIESENR